MCTYLCSALFYLFLAASLFLCIIYSNLKRESDSLYVYKLANTADSIIFDSLLYFKIKLRKHNLTKQPNKNYWTVTKLDSPLEAWPD